MRICNPRLSHWYGAFHNPCFRNPAFSQPSTFGNQCHVNPVRMGAMLACQSAETRVGKPPLAPVIHI